MKETLLPADTYIVKNSTILNSEDRLILTKLYQPVIGITAVSLYFTLWSDLDASQIISNEYNHHNLMTEMRIKLEDIIEAREKLEAIGLIKTYLKKDSINTYIYELYSPLSPEEFFENPILNDTLESNVGPKMYGQIVKIFQIPKINLKEYKDVSAPFNKTFKITNKTPLGAPEDIRKVKQLDILIDEKVDLNNILSLIPEEILNPKNVMPEIKSLIYKLAFIYNLNEEELSELIRNSVNEKHLIDKDLLRTNCKNYYTFEYQGKTPSLIYKNQPEYLRKQITDTSKKSKMIYAFETTTPYDFLISKNKGAKPAKNDLTLIETLLVDYNLSPGVVNVLVDYVLRINSNKLTKNFCLAIASQWKRENIKTAEEAMNFCKKENKPKQTKKKEELPKWYGKSVEENTATEEDLKKLEEKLKNI